MGNLYQRINARLASLSFDNLANQQGGFGTLEEINRITPEEVQKFYQTYLTPSNAGLVLVGDLDPAKVRERVKHYFEDIPARPAVAAVDSREPGRGGEKRESAVEPGTPTPCVFISWRVPSATDPEWFQLKRLAELLAGTPSSRLQESLVKTAGVASSVGVALQDGAGPNLLITQVLVAPGKDMAQAESLVYQEIENVVRQGVTKEEMERTQTESLRRRAFSMVTTTIRAQVFAQFLVEYGRLGAINDWEGEERKVTSEDLKRVAQKYLTPANRTVITVTAGAGGTQ